VYAEVAQTCGRVWYEDAESLSLKYGPCAFIRIAGIGIWALTYDRGKSELWDLIERRFPAEILPHPPEITAPQLFSILRPADRIAGTGKHAGGSCEIAVGTSPGGTDISGFQAVGLRSQSSCKAEPHSGCGVLHYGAQHGTARDCRPCRAIDGRRH